MQSADPSVPLANPTLERFCQLYARKTGRNATRAAILCGIPLGDADTQGNSWLQLDAVRNRIRALGDRTQQYRPVATPDDILQELHALAFSNVADYIDLDHESGVPQVNLAALGRDQSAALSEVSVKDPLFDPDTGLMVSCKAITIKLHDKQAALNKLVDVLGVHGAAESGTIDYSIRDLAKAILTLVAEAARMPATKTVEAEPAAVEGRKS